MATTVLVTGANGQVGRSLVGAVPADIKLHVTNHTDLDIGDAAQVSSVVDALQPDVIINLAAYTQVDLAEMNRAEAHRANAEGPHNLALAARRLDQTRLLHISTDYVFDGQGNLPYRVTDPTSPLNVYGETKLAGEIKAQAVLADRLLVVRTGWVYSKWGANFVRTMLRLMGSGRDVGVVDDQVGTPTSARSLADVIWRFVERTDLSGIFHWSDAGVASWYDFAVAIAEEGNAVGLLSRRPKVRPIPTTDYPTPATRPRFSVLDKKATWTALELTPVHWRETLRALLREWQRG